MSDINRIRNQIVKFYDKKKAEKDQRYHRFNSKLYKYYHSPQWQALRTNYYMQHPTCEVCDKQGVVTATDEIHHLFPYGQATNEEQRWKLLLSPSNLCSCCKRHHLLFHKYMRDNYLNRATIDELIEYEKQEADRLNQFD